MSRTDQVIKIGVISTSEELFNKLQGLLASHPHCVYEVDHLAGDSEQINEDLKKSREAYIVDLSEGAVAKGQHLSQHIKHKPVVAVTDDDYAQAESTMLRYGADDYVCSNHLETELLHRIIQFSIQRKQINDSFLREKQRLEAVTGIMNTFLRTNDWSSVSRQILQQVLLTTNASAGFLAVLNDENKFSIVGTFPDASWQVEGRVIENQDVVNMEYSSLHDTLIQSLEDSLPMATTKAGTEAFKTLKPTREESFDNFLSLPLTNLSEIVGFVGITRAGEPFSGRENLSLFTILQTSGVVFDIYRRQLKEVQLEDQLRRSQKMESVGRLAGGVAHDFNNLLTVINGYSEIVLESAEADGQFAKEVGEILKAGKNAADLTRQLLAFGRRQVFSPAVSNLNDIFKKLETFYKHLLKTDINVQTDFQVNLGEISIDVAQIEQVIIKLLINSQDAMSRGGSLKIKTYDQQVKKPRVHRDFVVTTGDYICFSIKDSGSGIKREDLENIFEPFFTTKEIGRGTGLGLAMVYGIIKQSGGYIIADSSLDEGTTMTVYFPRYKTGAESVLVESDDGPAKNGTILVVDDDREVLTLAGKVLRDKGYKVLEAYNPGEACFIAEKEEENIELMLTDVVMPIMNGLELASRIQIKKPEMKLIFMSGCAEEEMAEYGINTKDHHFIQKPFKITALAKKVDEVLRAKQKP